MPETRPAADHDDGDLGRRVRTGLTWSFGSNVLSRITTLLTGIVMARLLAPEDFGVFAVAMVALTILANINDLGLEQAVVRWPGDIGPVAPTAMTVIMVMSSALCAGCVALAGPFSQALGAAEATPIVRLMALSLLFNGAFALPSAVLTREFRQDKRTIADLGGFLVGTVITLVMAVLGYGPWALAWGRFVGNAVVSLMHFAFASRRYRPGWDRRLAVELLRSGLPIGGATLLAVALLNVDYVLVGRYLGTEALGYYTLAFNLASWPVTFFAVAVARVSVPAFARLQHRPVQLQSAYNRSSPALMAVTIPACLLLAVFADPLVRLLYGEKWVPAVLVLQLLCGLGLLRVVYQYWADILVAVGAGGRALLVQVCWFVALVPSLVVAMQWGLAGVGVAHLVVAGLLVGPVNVLCMRGIVHLGRALRAWLVLGLAAALAGLLGLGLVQSSLSSLWVVLLGAPLVLGAYGLLVWRAGTRSGVDPSWWAAVRDKVAVRLHRGDGPTAA